MGVGSETYSAIVSNRRAIGIELKDSYFRQAIKNMEMAKVGIFEENIKQEDDMFEE